MAKERKEYFYNPIDFNNDVGGSEILENMDITEEQAVSNLKNLLLTRKGERPFQPLFGSDVYFQLFENIDLNLNDRISETLSEDIKFWLPYIVIDNIDVQTEPDRNFVKIQLRFRVTEQGANQQITVFYDSAGSTIE